MGRRLTKIKVDVTWETTDAPNAILPWVRATEILLRAQARRAAHLEKLEKENPTAFLVESLISFARRQEGLLLYTHSRVPFRVEVPLDMIRQNKGLMYILETTGRTRTEPLSALTWAAERYLLTHSLDLAEYREGTKNAPYTMALVGQFLSEPK